MLNDSVRYEEYLNAESRVNRKIQHDSRVHCCLYFLESNSHGLTPLDVEFMQRLHDKVNIIPIISKADTMTPDEVSEYKKQVINNSCVCVCTLCLHKYKFVNAGRIHMSCVLYII